MVGEISSRAAYLRYARGLLAFRRPAELALQKLPPRLDGLRPTLIAPLIALDIRDLRARPLPDQPFDMAFDMAGVLGALYVLEGSGLGARVLVKEALKLGLGQDFGARHLALQASSLATWHALLAKLESAPDVNIDRVGDAANLVFDVALQAMMRARNAEE